MVCENGNITIAFTGNGHTWDDPYLELRPITVDFSRDYGEFDYLRAKFSDTVGKHIEGLISKESHFLNQYIPVVVKIEGQGVHRLLYKPDSVRFGENYTHIEFHDMLKYLEKGIVDIRRESIALRDIYRDVFASREKEGPTIFKDIKFTSDLEFGIKVIAEKSREGQMFEKRAREIAKQKQLADEGVSDSFTVAESIRNYEQKTNNKLIEGKNAVDFNKISPLDAIAKLNETYGISTWMGKDGNLWVGTKSSGSILHLSSEIDRRVWSLDSVNVNEPRDPVVKVTAQGKFVDDPTETWAKDGEELLPFNDKKQKNYRTEGVAERTNVDFGQEKTVEVEGTTSSLEAIAARVLLKEQKKQWEGTIELNPELSGDEFTDIRTVRIGDYIRTLPDPTEHSERCDSGLKDETYEITGVTHNIDDSSHWKVTLDVIPILDGILSPEHIETHIRYFNPLDKDELLQDEYTKEKSEPYEFWDDLKELTKSLPL